MQITAQLQHMSILAEKINDIQRKIKSIAYDYETTKNNLDEEIKGRGNINNLMREVDENLSRIILTTKNYEELLVYSCDEYRKSEEKINKLYQLYQQNQTQNKHSKVYSLVEKHKDTINNINLNIIKTVEPCPLPNKEQITMSRVTKGVIEEGKNIYIRTWKK
ncbi:hypothetical protein [Vallitalea guaymasensis]|uniref:hypothetical protein n=1 Tax=Vallitalea guaymasensis TaxID=1185412 RepID=UPI00272A66D7|nr:hypothetical protein [Vallitalea guaymasensis]